MDKAPLTQLLPISLIQLLKQNPAKLRNRIVIEELPGNYYVQAIKLATSVFTDEQNIPCALVPLKKELHPHWWCARIEEDILGVVASWMEEKEWHWGRFAIDRRLRGMGFGKMLAEYSLRATFGLSAEIINVEARDITVQILKKLGGRITGQPVNFYGGPVTPMVVTKTDFFKFKR